MKPTLSELYRGEIKPKNEKNENDEKIRLLSESIDKYYTILWNKLDDDGKKILCNLQDYFSEYTLIKNEDAFAKGFSLAVKMITEAISE